MQCDVVKSTITVAVDGELVSYEIYTDSDTGLDVDPITGVFRTRDQTEEFIKDVYRIGRDALPKELERYNKWMREGSRGDASSSVLQRPDFVFPNAVSPNNAHAKKQDDERNSMENAENLRMRGNDAMQNCDPRRAISLYKKGLRYEASSSILWSNMSAAKLLLGRSVAAFFDAEKAIELDTNNVKAYYRKTSALCMMGLRTTARRCIKDLVDNQLSADTAWESLDIKAKGTSVAVLLGDQWICTEDVRNAEELCALEAINLPCESVAGTLQIWVESGIPQDVLAKEAAYYAARGSSPAWSLHSGALAVESLRKSFSLEIISTDILRWSCILGFMGPCKTWTETIFAGGYVVLGASRFLSSPESMAEGGNVGLYFDENLRVLRVVARRAIKQYETLFAANCSYS